MMETPIADFVAAYADSGTIRFHMPGHKGVRRLGCERDDITEVHGADSLYEADGIIAASEANATALFGFGQTYYSTEGSSQCIKAMLCLAMREARRRGSTSRRILTARNIHKAFIHAAALLDLDPVWLYEADPAALGACSLCAGSLCECTLHADRLRMELARLDANPEEKPFAVYITAPDYLGKSPDIAALAAICREYGVLLLVDNAHGAYLKFLPESRHPIDLGAFMSCDSAHKTLPVLTGGAYLQLSRDAADSIPARAVKNALALFGSTSPSYLILQSLDRCNRYLADGYRERLAAFLPAVALLKQRLCDHGWSVADSDPLKLTLETTAFGYSGKDAADRLRTAGIEAEFADLNAVVFMLTPENSAAELALLGDALCGFPRREPASPVRISLAPAKRMLSVREAFFAPSESVPTAKAVGRICASAAVSCPPAIPAAVSGEVISAESVAAMQAYGIDLIDVVCEE